MTEYIQESVTFAAEIIQDWKRSKKGVIKIGKMITIRIEYEDETEVYYKVTKAFWNKYLKQNLNNK